MDIIFLSGWAFFCFICATIFSFRARKYSNAIYIDGLFFFGSTFDLQDKISVIIDYILEFTLQFQKTFAMSLLGCGLFPRGVIVLVRPEDVKYILDTNFENYVKGQSVVDGVQELVGKGIFAADGAIWNIHRKVASRMFTKQLMQNSADVMKSQTVKLINILKNRAQTNTEIDIQDMFFRLTIDVFCEVAFGIQLNSIETKDAHQFAKAFDEVQYHCEKRFSDVFWRIKKLFGCYREARITEGVKILNDFAETVINGKRRDAEKGNLGPDLLSRFLDEAKSKNETVSNEELRDIVMNFIIAGRDTTACSLSWTIYELNRHPEIFQEVIKEIQNTEIGENLASASVLPYLHAVIMESLRLHPSVPKQLKYAVKDDVLPDKTTVKSGMAVLYSSYALNRNPELWEDPLSFKPERWLESVSPVYIPKVEPSTFKYVTFNAGRRICLGKGLALMELKLVLSLLLPIFSFEEKVPHSGEYNSALVLAMKDGFHVVPHIRQ
eukprot:c21062_g1_i3.p1 GENE.c21062_g1_i3~~c21062_g1_i3.p1  ORF type:complete len:507 (-),score=167.95 c21062_g1_i3:18-1502(-)